MNQMNATKQKNTKYITFAVPCYNSQDYMKRCIDSLLPGGDEWFAQS